MEGLGHPLEAEASVWVAEGCRRKAFGAHTQEAQELQSRGPYCGWTKSVSHRFKTMVETIVCWYLQGNRIRNQGFLGGAEWISSMHSTNPSLPEIVDFDLFAAGTF